jgi:hypothetical protein
VSPAQSETRVPVARLALRQLAVRAAAPSRPPVFHVFEELYERALQGRSRDVPQAGAKGRSA